MGDVDVERSGLTVRPPARGGAPDDEIGADEMAAGRQQPTEQRRRHRERRIRHDSERPAGKAEVGRVDLYDDDRRAGEPLTQNVRSHRVQLHCNDTGARLHERFGERAGTRADVDDEISWPHARLGNEALRGSVSESMPSPAWPPLPGGHDAPSRSSSAQYALAERPVTANYSAR